jgi:hypothetical protein
MKTKTYLILLAALPVLLGGCDKTLEGGGKKAAVQFSVQVADFGSESIIRNGAGVDRVIESVEIPLEKNWVLMADLVEEAASPARGTDNSIVNGAKVWIVAYNAGSTTEFASASYTYNNGVLTGGPIELTIGNSYDIVAYAYNTASPPSLAHGATVNDIQTSHDLLWGKITNWTMTAFGSPQIPLGHQFMRFKRGTPKLNDGITNAPITFTKFSLTNKNGDLTVQTGEVAATGSPAEVPLTTNYEIAYPAQANNGSQSFTVKISGKITNVNPNVTFTNEPVTFHTTLTHGYSYALQINLRQQLKWAGSNIYWDGNNLTFDPHGTTTHQMYMGLLFFWGSLIGISPLAHPDGQYPSEYNGETPTYSYDSDITGTYTNYEDVPKLRWIFLYDGERGGLDADNFALRPGNDICRYIGTRNSNLSGYRMPTYNELVHGKVGGVNAIEHFTDPAWTAPAASNSWSSVHPASYNNNPTYPILSLANVNREQGAMGRAVMTWGGRQGTRAVFPLTGARDLTGSVPDEFLRYGCYWSSSRGSSDSAHPMLIYLGKGGGPHLEHDYTTCAHAVRCVKIE